MTKSIVASCDTYYYMLAGETDIDDTYAFMSQFGFGQKTGIDLEGELPGRAAVADMEARALLREQLPRRASQMVSRAIRSRPGSARDTTPSRPLQQAQAIAIIANDGVAMRPRVVKAHREYPHWRAARIALGADARARRQAAGSRRHQEGADRCAARRHQRGGIPSAPSTYPRARPAPRRSILAERRALLGAHR